MMPWIHYLILFIYTWKIKADSYNLVVAEKFLLHLFIVFSLLSKSLSSWICRNKGSFKKLPMFLKKVTMDY